MSIRDKFDEIWRRSRSLSEVERVFVAGRMAWRVLPTTGGYFREALLRKDSGELTKSVKAILRGPGHALLLPLWQGEPLLEVRIRDIISSDAVSASNAALAATRAAAADHTAIVANAIVANAFNAATRADAASNAGNSGNAADIAVAYAVHAAGAYAFDLQTAFFVQAIADEKGIRSRDSDSEFIRLASAPLWDVHVMDPELLDAIRKMVASWAEVAATAGCEDDAKRYTTYAFERIDLNELQLWLYGAIFVDVTASQPSQRGLLLELPEKGAVQRMELPVALQTPDRWGELIYQAALLNREHLKNLNNPTSAGICQLIGDLTKQIRLDGPKESSRSSSKRVSKRTSSIESSVATSVDPLQRIEVYVRHKLAEMAQLNSLDESDFLAPKLWLSWLRNVHGSTLQQMYLDVAPILSKKSASRVFVAYTSL